MCRLNPQCCNTWCFTSTSAARRGHLPTTQPTEPMLLTSAPRFRCAVAPTVQALMRSQPAACAHCAPHPGETARLGDCKQCQRNKPTKYDCNNPAQTQYTAPPFRPQQFLCCWLQPPQECCCRLLPLLHDGRRRCRCRCHCCCHCRCCRPLLLHLLLLLPSFSS